MADPVTTRYAPSCDIIVVKRKADPVTLYSWKPIYS